MKNGKEISRKVKKGWFLYKYLELEYYFTSIRGAMVRVLSFDSCSLKRLTFDS